MYGWGFNAKGSTGTHATLTSDVLQPALVLNMASYNITMIAVGDYHSLALSTNGDVLCWGDNSKRQCVDSDTNVKNIPYLITNRGAIPALHRIVQIGAGYETSFFMTHTGRIVSAAEEYYLFNV